MRRVRPAAVLLLVLVLAALAPNMAIAQSSTNGLIVFRSDRDGEPDLFTLDVVTGATTKLTNSAGFAELQPAWSPDGGRILYVRRARLSGRPDLFVMNANGRGRTRLTSTSVPERDPSWSPDGTALVYAARTAPGEPFRIFVARADGSGRQQLTSQKAGSDRAPVWSPGEPRPRYRVPTALARRPRGRAGAGQARLAGTRARGRAPSIGTPTPRRS